MFFGAQLKPGQYVTPSIDDGGEILHLSQICLIDPKDEGSTLVQINDGDKNYGIAVLQKGKCEHVSLDLFISTLRGIRLSTKGAKNEVHVVGYFEPETPEDDDESEGSFMDGLNDDKIEDLDDDDDDDEFDDDDKLDSSLGLVRSKGAGKKEKKIEEISDSDAHAMPNGVDKNFVDVDDKEGKKKKKMEKQKNVTVGGANKMNQGGAMNQKRKAQNLINKGNDGKKQKGDMSRKFGVESNEDNSDSVDKFKKELVKFLTVNGKTNLGMLGQKIKKPQQIDKLGQFIKEQAGTFKLENGFVSLVK